MAVILGGRAVILAPKSKKARRSQEVLDAAGFRVRAVHRGLVGYSP